MSYYPFIRLSVYPFIRLSVYPFIRLSVYPFIRLSVYPFIRLLSNFCQPFLVIKYFFSSFAGRGLVCSWRGVSPLSKNKYRNKYRGLLWAF